MTRRSWAPRMGALRPERGKKNGTGEGRGEDECCKGSSWHGLLAKFKLLLAMWLLTQYGACEVQRLKTFLCVWGLLQMHLKSYYLFLWDFNCFFFPFTWYLGLKEREGLWPSLIQMKIIFWWHFLKTSLTLHWYVREWGGRGVDGLLLYKLAIIHKFSIQIIIIWALHSRIRPTACFCRKSGKKFRCISQNLNWSPSLKAWVTGTELYLRCKCSYKMALAICACSLWNDWLNSRG